MSYIICHPTEVAFTSSGCARATRPAQSCIYILSIVPFGAKEFCMGGGVKHATSVAGGDELTL